ncbi:DUF4157 domain-containing protein (plasmid) [Nostoc sp. C052]|nr:DUF4157 domain-containing protein [Nostoc sp. C052]
MDGLLNSRLSHATRFGHNIANIPLRRPDTPTSIQTKLTIGEPGDKYEQEADETARQIVQRIHQSQGEKVQRESLPLEEEELQMKLEGRIQRESLPAEEDELQMKPVVQRVADEGMATSPDLETSIQQARGSGQPLADSIKSPMEQAFEADFSRVKVHTDTQADQLNQSIQAKAFTTGQDVFFRQGAYEPGSLGGQELLAHELTHVVQQNGGVVMRSPLQTGQKKLHKDTSDCSDANICYRPFKNIPVQRKLNTIIQRVSEEDAQGIYKALPLEYQAHFQTENTIFSGENQDERTTRNDTLQKIWKRVQVKARIAGNKEKPKQNQEQILKNWTVADASEALKKDADSIVQNEEENRKQLHGDGKANPFTKGGQIIDFEVEGIGSGELEVVLGKKDVLLFAAHGFTHSEGLSHVFNNDEKAFGFMSGPRESVERSSSTVEKYEEMAKKLRAEAEQYKVTGVPDVVVYPHFPNDAIKDEGEFLQGITDEMDIAILRNWKWDKSTELGKKLATAFVNTVPITFILGSPPLNGYNNYLMQVCRADWSREVPVSGGSKRTSAQLTKW